MIKINERRAHMKTYLYAKGYFLPEGLTGPGYLEIANGKFGSFSTEKPTTGKLLNFEENLIAPGLVDTHIHGYQGFDVMDQDLAGLNTIATGILTGGVTSFLPTTLTASTTDLDGVCRLIGEHAADIQGAKVQGIFLEGPFFSETYKGAQNAAYMSDPDVERLSRWQKLAKGLIRKIAIAPERAGSLPFITYAKEHHIHVAIAHTDATYEECRIAVDEGASIFVHTFNGMRGLHHREPGVVGAALSLQETFMELICDGHHVHPVSAGIAMDAHGRETTMLVSDCMRGGGLGDGHSRLGEFDVTIKDGVARLDSNGALAGSVLDLITAVRNVVAWGIATPEEAIQMASLIPAKSVGIDDECGQIKEGYAADFIVLSEELILEKTYMDGVLVYTKQ